MRRVAVADDFGYLDLVGAPLNKSLLDRLQVQGYPTGDALIFFVGIVEDTIWPSHTHRALKRSRSALRDERLSVR